MAAEPSFRLLGPQDHAAVLDLFRRAEDYTLLESGRLPGPETAADFFASAPPGGDPASGLRPGLFIDGVLQGIAEIAFGFPSPDDAYLGLMLLAPAARGRGLGAAFLDHIIALARDRAATRLCLAVLQANPRGRAFWERHGFRHELSVPAAQFGDRWHIRHRLVRDL